jgi:hypothetical protein
MKLHAVMEMVVVKWACGVVGAWATWGDGSGGGPRCGCATRGQAVIRGSLAPGPGFVSGLAV